MRIHAVVTFIDWLLAQHNVNLLYVADFTFSRPSPHLGYDATQRCPRNILLTPEHITLKNLTASPIIPERKT